MSEDTSKTKGIKKGKTSWKPASVTEVLNKEKGFRYRWINKEPDNVYKKEAEGWEKVSGLTSDKSKAADDGRVHTGKNLTSINEKHDVMLYRMPEESAESRDDYIAEKTRRRTSGLTTGLKKEIREKGGNAPIHGNITISSLGGETVIE